MSRAVCKEGMRRVADEHDYRRVPGLYRVWDLQFLLQRDADYRIDYAEQTEDGTPLFAVYTVVAQAGDNRGRPQ